MNRLSLSESESESESEFAPRVWRYIHGVRIFCERWLSLFQAPALFAARFYVASVFFRSGLLKIADWGTTLALFQDEYHVPLLPPELAAVMGTCGELVLPVLLVLGLFSRFAGAGLFVVNVVAALSLADIAPAALQQHQFWGSLLLGVILWGPGPWSVDHWALSRWFSGATAKVP